MPTTASTPTVLNATLTGASAQEELRSNLTMSQSTAWAVKFVLIKLQKVDEMTTLLLWIKCWKMTYSLFASKIINGR